VAVRVAAAVVWGVFVAPRAPRPLIDPWRLVLELALLGSAVAGLALIGHTGLAVVFGALVVLHLVLTFALRQRPPRRAAPPP
jgi:hypothetical protein